MKRLAFVLPPGEVYDAARAGAIATVTAGLAEELRQRGISCFVVSARVARPLGAGQVESFPFPRPLSLPGKAAERVILRVGRYDHWQQREYARQVDERLRHIKPDRVIVHNEPALASFLADAGHDVSMYIHNEFRTRARRGALVGLRKARSFVAVSQYLAAWSFRQLWAPPTVARKVVPSGVNLRSFTPHQGGSRSNSDLLTVAYLGRIDETKGPDIAVQAAMMLLDEGLPLRLDVRGPRRFNGSADDEDAYLRGLKALASPYPQIRLLPPVPPSDVPALMRRIDVLVAPSRCNEGLSLAALEAIASGVPVIGSDLGGLPEAVGDCGLVVAPEARQFAGAIRTLIDPVVYESYRQACLKRRDRLSWFMGAGALLEALDARSDEKMPH